MPTPALALPGFLSSIPVADWLNRLGAHADVLLALAAVFLAVVLWRQRGWRGRALRPVFLLLAAFAALCAAGSALGSPVVGRVIGAAGLAKLTVAVLAWAAVLALWRRLPGPQPPTATRAGKTWSGYGCWRRR
jgi:hypothetical protein